MVKNRFKFVFFILLLGIIIANLDAEVLIIEKNNSKKDEQKVKTNYNYVYNGSNNSQLNNIRGIARRICMKKNINHLLVESMIQVESNFNPRAVSHKGAKGLMQLMPETAEMYGVDNIFDIRENLRAGIDYFKYLFNRFNQNVKLALAAYNAGPTVVKKYNGIPPYRETERYVKKILEIFNKKGGDLKQLQRELMVHNNDGNVSITNDIYKSDIRRKNEKF